MTIIRVQSFIVESSSERRATVNKTNRIIENEKKKIARAADPHKPFFVLINI